MVEGGGVGGTGEGGSVVGGGVAGLGEGERVWGGGGPILLLDT